MAAVHIGLWVGDEGVGGGGVGGVQQQSYMWGGGLRQGGEGCVKGGRGAAQVHITVDGGCAHGAVDVWGWGGGQQHRHTFMKEG
jgi:hypothetical protein